MFLFRNGCLDMQQTFCLLKYSDKKETLNNSMNLLTLSQKSYNFSGCMNVMF